MRVELTNERVAASYSADEYLPHIQDSGTVTAIEPRFITPFDSVIIINLIGFCSVYLNLQVSSQLNGLRVSVKETH